MTNTRWDLTAETKALIVVDMQNGFLKPDGFMVKAGLNIDQCIAAIGPNQSVIAACREEGIPVIYTRYSLRPDYKDAGLLTSLYPGFESTNAMVIGTRDWEIAEELKPMDGDIIVDKQRYSAFYGTNLEVTSPRARYDARCDHWRHNEYLRRIHGAGCLLSRLQGDGARGLRRCG